MAHLLAPILAADDDGVTGDLQAGSVGQRDFAIQVVAHRSGGELLPCGGDGLSRDQWGDLRGGCDELRFAHGFGVVWFVVGIDHRGHGGHRVEEENPVFIDAPDRVIDGMVCIQRGRHSRNADFACEDHCSISRRARTDGPEVKEENPYNKDLGKWFGRVKEFKGVW